MKTPHTRPGLGTELDTGGPVLDIHTHPRLGDQEWLPRVREIASYWNIRHLVALGDVFAFGWYPTAEQLRAINDQTMSLVREDPELVTGFCHLNPSLGKGAVTEEITRCISDGNLRGFKLEVTTKATDRALDPVMEAAEESGVPVLHHTWYKTTGLLPHESNASDIADLAGRFPGVTIVMAHLTAAGVRGVRDLVPHPNVMVDTSGSQPEAGIVEYAVRLLGAERLVYGSDIPGRDFSSQIGRILSAGISPADRRAILYDNAAALLNREQEEVGV